MPDPRLLEFHPDVEPGASRDEAASLRQEIRSLRQQLKDEREQSQDAIREARRQSSDAMRAQAKLKQYLQPFHTALQLIFGELEHVDANDTPPASPSASNKWDLWKTKLGGLQADFIQAMQDHGEVTASQLKTICHCGSSTIPQIILRLNKLQLINKNGGRYSLKEL